MANKEHANDDDDMADASNRCFFEEHDEVQKLLLQIVQDSTDPTDAENAFENAKHIFEKYQEMPQLLNPHIEGILSPLVARVSAAVEDPQSALKPSLLLVARLLYVVAKVRGFKAVVAFFPNEVHLLEPVFHFYLQLSTEFDTWELRYVLLLWLSTVCLVPFHLGTVDSAVLPAGLVGSMVEACQNALSETGLVKDGAAFLLARLLTRPDTAGPLHTFLAWATPVLSEASDTPVYQTREVGVLQTLAYILRYGQRLELLPHVEDIANIVVQQSGSSLATVRSKLLVKIAQRVAMVYLPAKCNVWQYRKGTGSLLQNLQHSQGLGASAAGGPTAMECDGADAPDVTVPTQVEELMGLLIEGLRHRDTVVRWSAAKGVGRVCQRLPKDSAEDVLRAVLRGCFDLFEAHSAWHGGCLCLAEMARRGLLLPASLSDVIPFVLRALTYSLRKTTYSIGANVQDAACYVCWACARAYRPTDLQQYVAGVSQQLVVVAVFDREVNVRRAAAAAFQECVGRLGTFPHGIDIVQLADYFTLAGRPHAFTVLAPQIAAFEGYCQPMMAHLLEHKLGHWDVEVRNLAAKALALLSVLQPTYTIDSVLPVLVSRCFSISADDRHGALLALGEVVLHLMRQFPGLLDEESARAGTPHLPAATVDEICQVIPQVEAQRLYRGRGGDKVRIAACRLIACLAECPMPLRRAAQPLVVGVEGGPRRPQRPQRPVVLYQESLEGHLAHLQAPVREAGVKAFRAFARQYYTAWAPDQHPALLRRLLEGLAPDQTPNVRRGLALALGALPAPLLAHGDTFHTVSEALLRAIPVEANPEQRDAEARTSAVRALGEACCTAPVAWDHSPAAAAGLHPGNVPRLLLGILGGLEDYSVDNRGDVGSFVRIAALEAAVGVLEKLGASDETRPAGKDPLLTPELWMAFLKGVLKQLMEIMDRVRAVAGCTLHRALQSRSLPDTLPFKRLLREPLEQHVTQECGTSEIGAGTKFFDWGGSALAFTLLVPLVLPQPELTDPVLKGLVSSVGGMSMHVVRPASAALQSALTAMPLDGPMSRATISALLHELVIAQGQSDRILIPTLRALDFLLTHRLLHPATHLPLLEALRGSLQKATRNDVNRLIAAINVVCGLLGASTEGDSAPELRSASLRLLLCFMGLKFPVVRTRAAKQLYTTLITLQDKFSDLEEGAVDSAAQLLLGAPWDAEDLATVHQSRDLLYPLLNLGSPPPPAPATGPAKAAPAPAPVEGYAALVQSAGY